MYNVAVTAIVINDDGQVLLTKRSMKKDKWPGKWTVPGGKVEDSDFLGLPTDINNQWYHTLENAVKREVLEETGYEITDISYVCNIAVPGTIIVSYKAKLAGGSLKEQEGEVDAVAWVWESELDGYDIIDGIKEEILEALRSA